MLRVYASMADLPFGKLMEIYAQSNREKAEHRFRESGEQGVAHAEQEFYAYLRQCFFTLPSARYFLWEEQGSFVSAVRCEGYRDGVLLTALETLPASRGKGYATQLLSAVLRYLGCGKVYVHIQKVNKASLAVHLRCGFAKVKSGARLLDGSYSKAYDTYMVELQK